MKPQKNHTRLTGILVCGVLFMFGFCYMLIPLFNFMCRQVGLDGKSVVSAAVVNPSMQVDTSRTIKVFFSTTIHDALHFKFVPLQRVVEVHPGEIKLVYFFAENQTGHQIIVQAVPSITPNDGARFLKKTQCFCFTQQPFFKNEKADMPVYFFIDPSVPHDIKEITLSYTLFDASGFEKKQKKNDNFTKGRIDL